MRIKTMATRKKNNKRKEQIEAIIDVIGISIVAIIGWIMFWVVSIVF